MNAERIVLTVFLAIVGYRLLFFALGLIGIAFFLLFVHLRLKFKRPKKQPQLRGKKSNSETQTSSSSLAHSPRQLSSPEEQRTSSRPLSARTSQLSCLDIGLIPPVQALTPNHSQNHLAVPFTETESPTISYRSDSIASQPLPAVARPLSGRRASQLHRWSSSRRGSILPDSNIEERHNDADTHSGPYPRFNDAELFPTAWSSLTPPLCNPDSEAPMPNVSISDKFPETPTSAVSVLDEGVSVETPGLRRIPTCDSMYTEKSVMTLPVYKENEDERMSIASRAPTYRSTITPRELMPPLPIPPSIYLPTIVSKKTNV